tara:strand:- start:1394 stop:1783 length:390 start_codon:yes stop_codon:yes gene_type:complete
MKLTKSKLQEIIQEEIDNIINEYDPPTSETFGIGDPGSMKRPSQTEQSKKCKDAGGIMAGDECQDRLGKPINLEEDEKNWMKGIKSTGECSPSTKPGCKGRAKAFAQRAQKGDIRAGNLKKGKNPHGPG